MNPGFRELLRPLDTYEVEENTTDVGNFQAPSLDELNRQKEATDRANVRATLEAFNELIRRRDPPQ